MGWELPAYPDAEQVVMALLESLAPTVTETTDPIVTPLIRVMRVGGNSDQLQDYPRMEIACYGATRNEAWQLQQQCEAVIVNSPGTEVAGTLIDNARTDNPPQQPPYANPDVRRVVAYYRFTWRRPQV